MFLEGVERVRLLRHHLERVEHDDPMSEHLPRCLPVSFAFSPLKSTTTIDSGHFIRCGMTHDTPLPPPVGAKTARCTALDSRTSAGGGGGLQLAEREHKPFAGFGGRDSRVEQPHHRIHHARAADVYPPQNQPGARASIPARSKSLGSAHRAVPKAARWR